MSSGTSDNGLPLGWTEVQIGDLVAPFENANPKQSGRERFCYVDIEAIDNRAHTITCPKDLLAENAPSRARKVIRSGDVLISLVRPYLKNIAIVPPELDEQWASTAFCVCRPRDGIEPRFLYYMFLQDSFVNGITTYGDSPPSGHDDDLLATTIKLPPGSEVGRIADRMDELFTDLDAGVAALERVRKKLPRYRAALLHAAVTGRLTSDWRAEHGDGGESSKDLLQRILKARRADWEARTLAKYEAEGKEPPKGWQKRYKEPAEVDRHDLPPLPCSWRWTNVDHCAAVQGGLQKSPARRPVRHHYPYLRVANVKRNRLELDELHRFELTPFELDKLRLEPDDILVVEGNGSVKEIGRSAMWKGEVDDCVHQNHIIRCRVFAGVSPDFANTLVNSPFGQAYMRKVASSTSGLHTLSVEKVRAVAVPLPPETEQELIVERVEEGLSKIDAMADEVERGLRRAGRLRQSILKSAFEGRLVPQDPTDDPASELLERIRAQDELIPPTKPRRKRAKKSAAAKPSNNGQEATLFDIEEAPAGRNRGRPRKTATSRRRKA